MALTKLKAFAADISKVAKMMIPVNDRVEKHRGERRKMLIIRISSFSHSVFQMLFPQKVGIVWLRMKPPTLFTKHWVLDDGDD